MSTSFFKKFLRIIFFSLVLASCFVVFSDRIHAQQAYKCKVDAGNCVPCSPDPAQPDNLSACATSFSCSGNPSEAAIACSFFDVNTCPGNAQNFACNVASTPPPSQLPQNAIPRPYVPCNQTRDNEFHSLRPYQASPCNQNIQDIALYCANSIIANDTFSSTKDQSSSCVPDYDNGIFVCDFNIPRSVSILVDLRNAKLPIAGNTEDVTNSQNAGDPSYANREHIDDAQKVNEYISWYLNGVNHRAEYPLTNGSEEKDGSTGITGHSYVVDYSGPLDKLLPKRIQIRERLQQVDNAHNSVASNANIRHNQIEGCTAISRLVLIFGPISVRPEVPIPCNRLTFIQSLFATEVKRRLAGNNGSTEWFEPQNRPPLEEDYANQPFINYWEAYQRWRGKICAQIPMGSFPTILLCVNDPTTNFGMPDYIAELFPSIPLSSTEDRVGDFRVEQNPPVIPQGSDPHGGDIVIDNEHMAGNLYQNLYFPHMQENVELSDLLQQTYVPQGIQRNGPPDLSVFTAGQFCEVRQARSNPGDSLFGQQLTTTLSYNAQFQCDFVIPPEPRTGSCTSASEQCHDVSCSPTDPSCSCSNPADPSTCTKTECSSSAECFPNGYSGCSNTYSSGNCGTGYKCADGCNAPSVNDCTVTTTHSIPTYTETPYADSIWSRLVAGPMGAFKKFFPKFGFDSPITQLQDIPAVTSSSYSTTQAGASVFAGSPTGQKPGTQAEIFFPHLGGIHLYFLQCLQRLIRPEGLGVGCDPDSLASGVGTSVFGQPVQISDPNRRSVFPWIGISQSGTPNIIYVQYKADDSGPENLMYSNGGAGQPLLPILDVPDSYPPAAIATGPNNIAHLVYSPDGERVYYKKATNGSWPAGAGDLISSATNSRQPRIAVDSNGNAHIAWMQRPGSEFEIGYRVVDANGNLGPAIAITNPAGKKGPLSITTTSDGSAHIVYEQNGDMYHSKINANNISNTVNISQTSENSYNPSVTSNGTRLFAVWGEGIQGSNHDILLSTSEDGGATWTASINLTNNFGLSDFPSVAFGASSGRAYITWADDSLTPNDTELWYAEYVASSNSFTTPVQISSLDNQQPSGLPVIATGAGGLGIVWQDRASGIWQVYYLGGTFGTTPGGGGGGTPPPGQCTQADAEIRARITTTWGLPEPQANATGGARGYTQLKSQISGGAGNWAALSMLAGERYAQGHGFPSVIAYLTTAWLWFENGSSGYPDPYSVNCNNNGTLSRVSVFCQFTNFQIGGYQAAESRKNYQATFNQLYGGTQFTSVLSQVINNSGNALRAQWSYTSRNPDINTGLMQYLTNVLTATSADLATSGSVMVQNPNDPISQKRQFLSLMAGKDPAMVATLNRYAVSDGDLIRVLLAHAPGGSNCGYGYICDTEEQILSNMIYALYQLDCGL